MAVEFTESYEFDGPVRWFTSSEWAERGSCERCGSALFWRMRDGTHFSASVGAFDEPSLFSAIESHIFIDCKNHYEGIAPRLTAAQVLERFGGDASQE